LCQTAYQRRVGEARCEHVSLEPVAGIEQARCYARRPRHRPARGCETRQRVAREMEAVGEQAQRLLALWGVLGLREHLARANESLLSIRRALDLEAPVLDEVPPPSREPISEAIGRIGRVLPS